MMVSSLSVSGRGGIRKAAALLSKDVDDIRDVALTGTGHEAECAKTGGTANATCICPLVCQGFEDLFADLLVALRRKFSEGFFCVPVERMRHGADRFVVW